MIKQFVLITCDGVLDGSKNCTASVSGTTVAQARAKGGWRKFLGGDLCSSNGLPDTVEMGSS
jgi:hypothetical protein